MRPASFWGCRTRARQADRRMQGPRGGHRCPWRRHGLEEWCLHKLARLVTAMLPLLSWLRRLSSATFALSFVLAMLSPAVSAGELSAADRIAAEKALLALIGAARRADFKLTSSGCGFDSCTAVVSRFAVFTQTFPALSPNLPVLTEVRCEGRTDNWACASELQIGVFDLGGRRDTPVLRGISPRSAFDVATSIRSACYRDALREDAHGASLPRWLSVELPLLGIGQSAAGEIDVRLGDAGAGLLLTLRPSPGESQCRFSLVRLGTYVT